MSENWQITLITLGFTGLLGVLTWIGSQLMGIRKELGAVVLKKDCVHDMENHCGLINKLAGRVEFNEGRLAEIDKQLAVLNARCERED